MLPAILEMLIALAGLAIGLFVRNLWPAELSAHRRSLLCFWRTYPRVVCIGLVVLFAAGVVWKGMSQIRFRTELWDKIEKAEALAKIIPKGCPEGVDPEFWNAKVEALRTEAAKRLGQAYAVDRGNYQHGCPLEWVWNRLDHFLIAWQGVALRAP